MASPNYRHFFKGNTAFQLMPGRSVSKDAWGAIEISEKWNGTTPDADAWLQKTAPPPGTAAKSIQYTEGGGAVCVGEALFTSTTQTRPKVDFSIDSETVIVSLPLLKGGATYFTSVPIIKPIPTATISTRQQLSAPIRSRIGTESTLAAYGAPAFSNFSVLTPSTSQLLSGTALTPIQYRINFRPLGKYTCIGESFIDDGGARLVQSKWRMELVIFNYTKA